MGARLLVLQPSDSDPPERLGEWLADAGAHLTLRRPVTDGVPESLDGVDGVVCMGGMGAHDDVDHPWLAALRWLLADAVAHRLPVLGVCLGGQLLATATGGTVRRRVDEPEAGTCLVAKRDAAAHDPLPLTPDVIQFHYDETYRLPPGTTLLASSPRHANQAFRVGTAGYGHDPVGAAAVPPGQLDPDHLEQVHADMAEVWGALAARFAALAAGELAVASLGLGERPALPLLGH